MASMRAELLTEYKNMSGKLNLKPNMKSKWAPFTFFNTHFWSYSAQSIGTFDCQTHSFAAVSR